MKGTFKSAFQIELFGSSKCFFWQIDFLHCTTNILGQTSVLPICIIAISPFLGTLLFFSLSSQKKCVGTPNLDKLWVLSPNLFLCFYILHTEKQDWNCSIHYMIDVLCLCPKLDGSMTLIRKMQNFSLQSVI